jgi:tRNA 2-thiouridine synthesizing protein A
MSDIKPDKTIDLKGLNCPIPVIKTKKAIESIEKGQVILVEITDAGSKSDIPALLRRTGNELIEMKEEAGVFKFLIRKAS